jgi:hypothetical protein
MSHKSKPRQKAGNLGARRHCITQVYQNQKICQIKINKT